MIGGEKREGKGTHSLPLPSREASSTGLKSWSFRPSHPLVELVDHEITLALENIPTVAPSSSSSSLPPCWRVHAPVRPLRGNLASTLIYLETVANTNDDAVVAPHTCGARVHVCKVARGKGGRRGGGRQRERERESDPLKGLVLISSVDNTHSLIPL